MFTHIRFLLFSLGFHKILQHPIMTLGTHRLKGTVEQLKLPFCVLEKDCTGEDDDDDDEHQTCYHVKGIVTKKLLFNSYPKTIMR